MQRHDVASTLIQRCLNVVCPLDCNTLFLGCFSYFPKKIFFGILFSPFDMIFYRVISPENVSIRLNSMVIMMIMMMKMMMMIVLVSFHHV